jgi:tetratricopeptide (TPR) repeat protein
MLHDLGSISESIETFENALASTDDDGEKCRAWIGMAAGMRIVDRYDDALEALDNAETITTARALTTELSRIHYLRGNIYFPQGNIERCLEQHQLALDLAREISSPEGEARALGGLADAEYMRGRMITAHKQFHQCIEVSRQNGFGRMEVANLAMYGFTRMYKNELVAASEDCRAAAAAAVKVGDQRAELVARVNLNFILVDMAEFAEAKRQIEQTLALARRLGSRRFEPTFLLNLARILANEDQRAEAVRNAEEAVAISRDTGFKFRGATALGVLAGVTDDPAIRRQALKEGERVLREGCLSHNYFWFYRDAMEICLELGDWDGVERYAAALADYTRPEPLPWSDFHIARARALSAHGRGKRDEATMDELQLLCDQAERAGLRLAVPDLESAIAKA